MLVLDEMIFKTLRVKNKRAILLLYANKNIAFLNDFSTYHTCR